MDTETLTPAEAAAESAFWRRHRELLQRADRELLRVGITSLRFRDPDTGEYYEQKMVDPDKAVNVFDIFTDSQEE